MPVMDNSQFIEYFVNETNKTFDKMQNEMKTMNEKMDKLIGFRWMLIGGSLAVSAIVSVGVEVFFRR